MKILFVRHGESQDDLENRYGGWSDFELTPTGQDQLAETASRIEQLEEGFEIILSSPLKRARSSAEIISSSLKLPVEIFEYVKERNTYGILSGMEKNEAKLKYPDQVEHLDSEEYVDGSERIEDLLERIKKALDLIERRSEKSIVVVTHGVFLKNLGKVIGKKLVKKEDGGFVLMELANRKLNILKSDGIEFE